MSLYVHTFNILIFARKSQVKSYSTITGMIIPRITPVR